MCDTVYVLVRVCMYVYVYVCVCVMIPALNEMLSVEISYNTVYLP